MLKRLRDELPESETFGSDSNADRNFVDIAAFQLGVRLPQCINDALRAGLLADPVYARRLCLGSMRINSDSRRDVYAIDLQHTATSPHANVSALVRLIFPRLHAHRRPGGAVVLCA